MCILVCSLTPVSKYISLSVSISLYIIIYIYNTCVDVYSKPTIAPNYLSTPEDCLVAADSIAVARRIIQGKHIHDEADERPGVRPVPDESGSVLTPYSPEEVRPGAHLLTTEELIEGARGMRCICVTICNYG